MIAGDVMLLINALPFCSGPYENLCLQMVLSLGVLGDPRAIAPLDKIAADKYTSDHARDVINKTLDKLKQQ